MKDLNGRTIDYLRISVTDLCNLRCVYCMPEEGVEKLPHDSVLTFEEITRIVRVLAGAGIKKLRLTGGEPLVRKGIAGLVRKLKLVDGIDEITMTTNGILLEEYAEALKEAGLDRVNVSIDSLDPRKYREITRGGDLNRALRGIDAAVKAGLAPVKINTVVMKGFNDSEAVGFADYAAEHALAWRFIEFMPLGGMAGLQKDKFVSNDIIKDAVKEKYKLNAIADGEHISKNYEITGTGGKIGFISSMSHKFCDSCNRMRLASNGKLVPCLLGDRTTDLRTVLRNGGSDEDILALYLKALSEKPREHACRGTHSMSRIGG